MKIYDNRADDYIKNIKPGNPGAILIYGPDLGAVNVLKKKIIAKLIPGSDALAVKEFEAESVREDPALLLDEVSATSFFAEQRVIVVEFAAAIAPLILDIISALPPDLTVIITAGELARDAKIRKSFDAHKSFPSIACYKEDERSIRSLIAQKFREHGIKADSDALNYLATNLGEDKQITANELDKILLYLGEQKTLNLVEVLDLLADSSELTLNEITAAVSGRNTAKLEKSLNRAFAEHMNAVPILRSVQWQFQRLANVKMMMQNGMAAEAALSALRPQVFKMQQTQFLSALHKWDAEQLKQALSVITNAELEAKASTIDPDITCRNALLKLAAA